MGTIVSIKKCMKRMVAVACKYSAIPATSSLKRNPGVNKRFKTGLRQLLEPLDSKC